MTINQLQARALAQHEVWAILPDVLTAALFNPLAESIVEASSDADLQAITKPGPKAGRLVRVPIFGSITHRDSFWSLLFGGGATVERLTATLREIGADPSIGTVLLEVDSPGGTVSGVPELAAEVRRLRESKRVVALANSLATSAAYWIASQADEIVATPEALIGSIGVFTVHDDYSQMWQQAGVKTTYISAGKYKTEANPDEPLSDEAREHLQSMVDAAYNLFVSDVAKGRGVTAAQVKSDYGQGRVLPAAQAKELGMIDRVASGQETMSRLLGSRSETVGAIEAPIIEGERLALLKRRLDLAGKI